MLELEQSPTHPQQTNSRVERGQALVEYVLIVVLVALIFGFALAATGPVLGNVFSNAIDDVLRQTQIGLETIPGKEEFWETVTAAFLTPLEEKPLPTNTKADPTTVPTAGPSPTHTPITPTQPPTATRTPSVTPTEWDRLHDFPWYDSVETPTGKWWRTDANINTLGSPWFYQFFPNTNLTNPLQPTPLPNPGDKSTPGVGWLNLNFTGTDTQGWMVGMPAINFSARFNRQVQAADNTNLVIRVYADDDVRVYMGGTLILDQWDNVANSAKWYTVSKNFVGTTDLVIEYRQFTGSSRLYVWAQGSANPDDTYVNGSGNPDTGSFTCGWGQNFNIDGNINGNNSNTELGMWDEFVEGDTALTGLPNNSRCYLELRGGVEFPVSGEPGFPMTRPQMVFWDVWDFKAGVSAWVEVAEYIQDPDPDAPIPSLDRGALNWIKIDNIKRLGGTRNYNMTRNVIDLTGLKHTDNTPLDLTKPLTFRFVIQNINGQNASNRWYVDDIQVLDAGPAKTFYINSPTWTLDEDAQVNDFIFTGGRSSEGRISGWRLVSNNKFGAGGRAFHDSAGALDSLTSVAVPGSYTAYKRNTQSPNSAAANDVRIHYLEFNGWISFVDALGNPIPVDSLGNKGDPALSFYQGYDLGKLTGLEVQYTTDDFSNPTPTWKTLDKIRDIAATTAITSPTLQERVVLLKDLPGNPTRIRLRFAMLVHVNADFRDGWWIDQIRVGREESPKWIDYPFQDDVQNYTTGPWRFMGKWAATDTVGRRNATEPVNDSSYKRRSYASSPSGNYDAAQKTWMEGRFPVDLYNDTQLDATQEKIIFGRTASSVPPISDPNNTAGVAAINPVLSFYHWRDLGNSDDFVVQWKRIDEADTAWRDIWFYRNGQATIHTSPNAETARQYAWEYVEIDLATVMTDINANNNAANRRDDDIVFRFVLDAKSLSSVGKGIYIDDIQLREKPNQNALPVAFKLWPTNENRNDPKTGTAIGNGNGINFFEDGSDGSSTSRTWDKSWFAGGEWFSVNWAGGKVGTFSFHDSPENQDKAPDGINNSIGETNWFITNDEFSVMQLNGIIDLRAVDSLTAVPMLFFWTRYHLGNGTIARVEISEEMRKADGSAYTNAELDADIKTRCKNVAIPQCYEQQRGWTSWKLASTNQWERKVSTGSSQNHLRSYGWTYEQIDLSPFSYNSGSNTPGKRIRIRFVLNTLTANPYSANCCDGWYIDNVSIKYTEPPLPGLEPVIIKTDTLSITPSSMFGWIGEGQWGLDPNIFEGSGGSPTTFGTWDAKWWNCSGTNGGLSKYCGKSSSSMRVGADQFFAQTTLPTAHYTTTQTGINYNMGTGRPTGWTTGNKGVDDYFAGQFVLNTPVVGTPGFPAGNRTLMILSDDGVRAYIQEIDSAGSLLGSPVTIINNWKDQSATTSTGPLAMAFGKRYRITIQYYENNSSATLNVTIGEGKYSLSDSPKVGGGGAQDSYPIPYGNTSLRLDRVLDLHGVSASSGVLLFYYTKYRVGNKTYMVVEASPDGGFTWDYSKLDDSFGNPNVIGSTRITDALNDPSDASVAWQQRVANLSYYKEQNVLLRFRLERQNEYCVRTKKASSDTNGLECAPIGGTTGAINGFYDGWWISRLIVTTQ